MPDISVASGALGAHRFLFRGAHSFSIIFAWIFILQFFYYAYDDAGIAFAHVVALYALSQVVAALLTPYAAARLIDGTRRRMLAGIFLAVLGLSVLALGFTGPLPTIVGVVFFAVSMGAYRAMYWTPYILEKTNFEARSHVPQEIFIALIPAIAGFALWDGPLAASVLLFSAALIMIASMAPLSKVPEMYEKFSWKYSHVFAELFESKHNHLVERSFAEGLQGTALMLLWPLTMFIIVDCSYWIFGLIMTATLLVAALFYRKRSRWLDRHEYLHATLAAGAWAARLVVAGPIGAVFTGAYSHIPRNPWDPYAYEQSADSNSYIDEFTVLKEIAQALGRIAMCVVAGVMIVFFSLPVGLGVCFVIAGLASAAAILQSKQQASASV